MPAQLPTCRCPPWSKAHSHDCTHLHRSQNTRTTATAHSLQRAAQVQKIAARTGQRRPTRTRTAQQSTQQSHASVSANCRRSRAPPRSCRASACRCSAPDGAPWTDRLPIRQCELQACEHNTQQKSHSDTGVERATSASTGLWCRVARRTSLPALTTQCSGTSPPQQPLSRRTSCRCGAVNVSSCAPGLEWDSYTKSR